MAHGKGGGSLRASFSPGPAVVKRFSSTCLGLKSPPFKRGLSS